MLSKYKRDARPEYSWSLLDPKPVLLYITELDEYIVYWNGVSMTYAQALSFVIAEMGAGITPEMKTAQAETYKRIYYSGGFGTREWDEIIHDRDDDGLYGLMKNFVADHVHECLTKYPGAEIIGWFDTQLARKG